MNSLVHIAKLNIMRLVLAFHPLLWHLHMHFHQFHISSN